MNNMYVALPALAARTAIVLLALLVGVRVVGKRHVGEMAADDILLILMVANAVQNAMTSGSGHLLVALACAATLLVVGWVAGGVFYRVPFLEQRVTGSPTILIHDGVAVRDNLRREQLTRQHLLLALHKQGVFRIRDVKLAVLEANGSISVVPREPNEGG